MSKTLSIRSLVLAALLLPLTLSAAPNTHAPRQKPPFPSITLPTQARGAQAIKALGNRLPEVAAWYGMTPQDFAATLRRDPNAWVDRRGRVFFMDEFPSPPDDANGDPGQSHSVPATHSLTTPAPIPYSETFKLHSRPGSNRVLFLDFDGHTVTGTRWNVGAPDPINFPAFSRDSDTSSFSNAERDQIHDAWRRVAEDYAPFDVDVTTEDPGYAALNRANSADQNYGTRALITLLHPSVCGSCGGAAYLGVFDTTGSTHDYYQPALVFYDRLGSGAKGIAEATSHEVGHNLGLRHDGLGSSSYYAGHGSGDTGWAPIMGVGYYQNLTQWSKGEYSGATESEDDIQIMQNNGAQLVVDDHANSLDSTSTPLNGVPDGNGLVSLNASGLIERRNDHDVFNFDSGAGDFNIDINPAASGPNLDIEAKLYDDFGVLLASSNPGSGLSASILLSNQPDGIYYLEIDGVGKGDPLATGYTDYASLGHYSITGSIPESQFLQAPRAVISSNDPLSGDAPLNINFSGAGSLDPDGNVVSYLWDFDDNGATSTATNPSYSFVDPGVYTVSLTVTDNDGLTDTSTVSVSTTNQPPVVSASATPTSGIASLTVAFSSAGSFDPDPTHSLSYLWDFGDGNSSNAANPSHLYTQAGNYNAVLTVSDNLGATGTAAVAITVDPNPNGPPAAPTNLSASKVVSGKGRNKVITVDLLWQDNAGNETQYVLERCKESGKRKNRTCNFSLLTTLAQNTVSYSESLSSGTYQYRVKAENAFGSSSYSNAVKVTSK